MSDNPPNRFYGKYRGTVLNNIDPQQLGRLQIQAPDVAGMIPTSWAMPCFPFTGKQMGMFAVPQVGAGVWVEFEQGNPDYPIWSGCWYGSSSEVPSMALSAPLPLSSVTVQTSGQNILLLSDLPGPTGGILLQCSSGAMISISDVGITITNGKGATIELKGSTVTINSGALSIT